MEDLLLTVKEASCYLLDARMEHSEQMIRRWLRQGKIKGIRSSNRKEGWRIPYKELDNFIYAQQWVGTPYEDGIDEQTMITRFMDEINSLQQTIRQLTTENHDLRRKLGYDDGVPF